MHSTNIASCLHLEFFPVPRVSFHLDRTFSYYVYRSYVPSTFLVVLTWGSFLIPATAYPARVGLVVTNFLASAFILQGASAEFTKVEYTTAIEIFLLANICFILLTGVEYIFVIQLHPKRGGSKWCKPRSNIEVKYLNALLGFIYENMTEFGLRLPPILRMILKFRQITSF